MVKLTWRLSLLFGLTLLFCGYCILLGALAGAALSPVITCDCLHTGGITAIGSYTGHCLHVRTTLLWSQKASATAGLTDACYDIPTDLPEHAGHYVTFLQWCGPRVSLGTTEMEQRCILRLSTNTVLWWLVHGTGHWCILPIL
jgi:hypothetical protein